MRTRKKYRKFIETEKQQHYSDYEPKAKQTKGKTVKMASERKGKLNK